MISTAFLYWLMHAIAAVFAVAALYSMNSFSPGALLPPLVALTFLALLVRIGRLTADRADELKYEIETESRVARTWCDPGGDDAVKIIDAIMSEKRHVDGARSGDLAGAAEGGPGSIGNVAPAFQLDGRDEPQGLPGAMIRDLGGAYIASEALDTARMQENLRRHAMSRCEFLHNRQSLAFMLGLLGTLAGLLIQVFIAQFAGVDAIFDNGFFNGAIIAGTSSAQGIVTALYVRSRWIEVQPRFDTLIQTLTDSFRRVFAPRLVNASQREVDVLARKIAEALRRELDSFMSALVGKFESFLHELPQQINAAISKTLADKVGEAVKNAMRTMTVAMERIKDELKNTEVAIKDGVYALKLQVDRFVNDPGELSQGLKDTLHDATKIEQGIEHIVEHIKTATSALQETTDQFIQAAKEQPPGQGQVVADLDQLVREQQSLAQLLGESISGLSGLVTGFQAMDTHIGQQGEIMEENIEKLTKISASVEGVQVQLESVLDTAQTPYGRGFFQRIFGRSGGKN